MSQSSHRRASCLRPVVFAHGNRRRVDRQQPRLRGRVHSRPPTAATQAARSGHVHGLAPRHVRAAGTRDRRRAHPEERGRRGHRRRHPIAHDLAAQTRHARDHPHSPHGLRRADLHGRRAPQSAARGDRAQARLEPRILQRSWTATCGSRWSACAARRSSWTPLRCAPSCSTSTRANCAKFSSGVTLET